MNYSRWMSLNTNIHNKKLANICLPMTHDSGTFDLSDAIVDPSIFAGVEKLIEDLVVILAPVLPPPFDPAAWLLAEAVKAVKGLATATKMNISEQMNGGMRGFDFRLYYNSSDGMFYTYHGMQSTTTFNEMVEQIRTFLTDTSDPNAHTGEIVYMNMSHYLGFEQAFDRIEQLVIDRLGDFAYKSCDNGTNDPFNATYTQIIGQDGVYKSRVILVSQQPFNATYFWPVNYCPPVEYRDQNKLTGRYTDSTKLKEVLCSQVTQFIGAVGENLPFANYMTMTPNGTDYFNIVASSFYGALTVLAADLALAGQIEAAAVVEGAALTVEVYHVIVEETLGWTTLEQLEEQIDKQMPELVDDYFLPHSPETNAISMIFCDFWESSEVVDLAIALSNDYEMQWGGNTGITVNSNQLKTTEGPSAALYRDQIYMVYKRSDGDQMNLAIYDPSQSKWIFDDRISSMNGGSSFTSKTNKSPSCAVYNDLLYVVWKEHDSNSIRYATWNGEIWSYGGTITAETNNSPYLANYKGMLALVNKGGGSDRIQFSTFNGSWSGGSDIAVTKDGKTEYPGTNKRPAIVEYDDELYLLFKGSHSNNFRQCIYDGASWSGNNEIKNSDEDFDPKSDEGPALARFEGSIQMIYKGEDHNDLWMSFFNGEEWGGNVKMKDATPIAPESNRSPWLVRDGLTLYLLNKSDNDDLMQSAYAPKPL